MPMFRHVNPLGACEVPLLGRVLEAGEVFEATAAQAELLREQPTNYAPAKAGAKATVSSAAESTTDKEGA